MVEKKTTVGLEKGLHARPVAEFVKKARRFAAEVTLIKGEREANGKSPMKVPTLGAKKGDEIVIRAEGEDAEAAVEALVEFVSKNDH